MYKMFYGCSSLNYLNLSNFDTSQLTDMSDMFSNETGLDPTFIEKFIRGINIEEID